MNNLQPIVMDILHNFTTNPLKESMSPYFILLGSFAYVLIALGAAAIVYTHTEGNSRTVGVGITLMVFLAVGSFVIHSGLGLLLVVIIAIVIGAILYKGFVAKEEY